MRRDRPEVDDVHFPFFGEIDEHEAHTAETAVPRLDRSEREACCDCGIDGIAAGIENAHTGFAGNLVLGGDDAAARARERFAHLPVLHEMKGHGQPEWWE